MLSFKLKYKSPYQFSSTGRYFRLIKFQFIQLGVAPVVHHI